MTDNVFNPKTWRQTLLEKDPPPPPKSDKILPADLGPVSAWSYSRLLDFEECPYRVQLYAIDKAPRSSGDAADRGTAIHTLGEEFVKGQLSELPKEFAHFSPFMHDLREAYARDEVELEGDWGFNLNWESTGFFDPDVWGRMKLDAFWRQSKTSAVVIDYKTGKKFGNELKHAGQGQAYAVGTFSRYPELEFIDVRFLYLDQNDEWSKSFVRKQMPVFRNLITQRALRLTTTINFEPRPSLHNCKFCPVKEPCQWKIEE